jgi:hypothetical protein
VGILSHAKEHINQTKEQQLYKQMKGHLTQEDLQKLKNWCDKQLGWRKCPHCGEKCIIITKETK